MVAISRFRLSLFVAPVVLAAAVPAQAQIATTKPDAALFLIRDADRADSQTPLTLSAISSASAGKVQIPDAPVPAKRSKPRSRLLLPLYSGFVTLQALDAHATFRAIDAGLVEQNPVMRWSTAHPTAFVSIKAAATAGTIFFTEKFRKQHPKGALALISVVNATYAFVVMHNYKAPVR